MRGWQILPFTCKCFAWWSELRSTVIACHLLISVYLFIDFWLRERECLSLSVCFCHAPYFVFDARLTLYFPGRIPLGFSGAICHSNQSRAVRCYQGQPWKLNRFLWFDLEKCPWAGASHAEGPNLDPLFSKAQRLCQLCGCPLRKLYFASFLGLPNR